MVALEKGLVTPTLTVPLSTKGNFVSTSLSEGLATDFHKAAEELSRTVNKEIANGWEPLGGIGVGTTQTTKEPYLFQAVVKR